MIEVSRSKTIAEQVRIRLFKDDRTNIDTCQENSRDFLSLGTKDTRWGSTVFFFLSIFQYDYLSRHTPRTIIFFLLSRVIINESCE